MPLYNNILLSKRSDAKGTEQTSKSSSSSNASMKFLQDHLLSKRRSQQQTPLSKAAIKQGSQDSKLSSQIISERTLHKPHENSWDPEDEYDPMVPNSYEVLQAEWIKSEDLRFASMKLAAVTNKKFGSNLLDVLDKLDDEDDNSPGSKQIRGTAIAPPPSLAKSSVTFSENVDPIKPIFQQPTPLSSERLNGSSVAAKIMSKMGYKVGQGLGKDEQGTSSPLEIEKSGANVGRIVGFTTTTTTTTTTTDTDSKLKTPVMTGELAIKQETSKSDDKIAELLRESTRVLLLQNMVGPGEVDDELGAETEEECKKYGDVVKCLIYEIPNKRVADDEAVRIFVEFRRVESAIKAVSDLNGRYFGGRIVRASFYSVERFNKYELGPL